MLTDPTPTAEERAARIWGVLCKAGVIPEQIIGQTINHYTSASLIAKEIRDAEAAARGASQHEVERLQSVLDEWIGGAESMGEKYAVDVLEKVAAASQAAFAEAGRAVRDKARTIGIIRLYTDGQADDAATELVRAIEKHADG